MSKLLIGGAIAAFAATAAFAQAAPAGKPGMHGRAAQPEARTEVAANVGKMFARLDTNKDGFITKAEVDALEAKRSQRLEKRAEGFKPDKIFDRIDTNKDARITVAEETAARNAMASAFTESPSGFRNSSASTSPGWVVTRLGVATALMIVDDFDIFRSLLRPSEANAPLVVDADRVLAPAIPGKRFQPRKLHPCAFDIAQAAQQGDHALSGARIPGIERQRPLKVGARGVHIAKQEMP